MYHKINPKLQEKTKISKQSVASYMSYIWLFSD